MPTPIFTQTIDWFLCVDGQQSPAIFFTSLASTNGVGQLQLVQGDRVLLRLWLCRRTDAAGQPLTMGQPHTLVTANGPIVAAIKRSVGDDTLLAQADAWTLVDESEDGTLPHYEAILNLNTTELIEAITGTAVSITARMDVELQSVGNAQRLTFTRNIVIVRQSYTGGEGPPEDAETPYPPPGDIPSRGELQWLLLWARQVQSGSVAWYDTTTGLFHRVKVEAGELTVGPGYDSPELVPGDGNPLTLTAVAEGAREDDTLVGVDVANPPAQLAWLRIGSVVELREKRAYVTAIQNQGGGSRIWLQTVDNSVWPTIEEGDVARVIYIAGPVGAPSEVPGPVGPPPTITMGTVSTGEPGTDVDATLTETDPGAYTLDLTVPRGSVGNPGADGATPVLDARFRPIGGVRFGPIAGLYHTALPVPISSGEPFTLIGKVRVGAGSHFSLRLVSARNTSSSQILPGCTIYSSAGATFWYLSGANSGGNQASYSSGVAPGADKWYDFAFVSDGSATKMWVDGAVRQSGGANTVPSESLAYLIVGKHYDGVNAGGGDEFTDLSLYRKALSDAEITARLRYGVAHADMLLDGKVGTVYDIGDVATNYTQFTVPSGNAVVSLEAGDPDVMVWTFATGTAANSNWVDLARSNFLSNITINKVRLELTITANTRTDTTNCIVSSGAGTMFQIAAGATGNLSFPLPQNLWHLFSSSGVSIRFIGSVGTTLPGDQVIKVSAFRIVTDDCCLYDWQADRLAVTTSRWLDALPLAADLGPDSTTSRYRITSPTARPQVRTIPVTVPASTAADNVATAVLTSSTAAALLAAVQADDTVELRVGSSGVPSGVRSWTAYATAAGSVTVRFETAGATTSIGSFSANIVHTIP